MKPALVLDEDCPAALAAALRRALPRADVLRMQEWHGGRFMAQHDTLVLRQLAEEGRALLTFDVNTIPGWLKQRFDAGESGPVVILVDEHTYRRTQIGPVAAAVARLVKSGGLPADTAVFLTRKP